MQGSWKQEVAEKGWTTPSMSRKMILFDRSRPLDGMARGRGVFSEPKSLFMEVEGGAFYDRNYTAITQLVLLR